MSNEAGRPQDLANRIAERRGRLRWLAVFGRRSKVLPPERAATEETSIETSRVSDQQLTQLIETSVSEVALMWVLHQKALSFDMRSTPLAQQIFDFSDAAFRSIKSGLRHLQDVEEAHLWLVYFKGLITANTHPREQMVRAINAVREGTFLKELTNVPEDKPRSLDGHSDEETLAEIAQALELTKNEAGLS